MSGNESIPFCEEDLGVMALEESIANGLNALAKLSHLRAQKWWHDPATGKPIERNKGEMYMLMVTELAEGFDDGARKGLADKHLPHRSAEEVEIADLIIRAMDYCGAHGFDIGGTVLEKMLYNQTREDHTAAARLAEGGKKF